MFTTVPQLRPQSIRRQATGLGHAYATLGLRARESRIDAIRQAASAAAVKVQIEADSDRLELLAEVAVCTYRLLDPRNRLRQIERVQLCILSERSLDLQAQSRRPLLSELATPDSMLQSA